MTEDEREKLYYQRRLYEITKYFKSVMLRNARNVLVVVVANLNHVIIMTIRLLEKN